MVGFLHLLLFLPKKRPGIIEVRGKIERGGICLCMCAQTGRVKVRQFLKNVGWRALQLLNLQRDFVLALGLETGTVQVHWAASMWNVTGCSHLQFMWWCQCHVVLRSHIEPPPKDVKVCWTFCSHYYYLWIALLFSHFLKFIFLI